MTKKTYNMRKAIYAGTVSALALTLGFGNVETYAQTADTTDFYIAAQSLSEALVSFSEQSDVAVMVPAQLVRDLDVDVLYGEMSPEMALNRLLQGSGLRASSGADGSYIIMARGNIQKISYETDAEYEENLGVYAEDESRDEIEGFQIDEIIVSATRRSESLQDIGMSVRALGMAEIDVRGIQAMGDYLASVPSVSYNEKGGGRNQISIRGISSGVTAAASGTVGYYFGEIPVSATARGNPDLKLFDVERIEILRGPQGTLYGSGSMGGAVRVIPASADLDDFSGSFEGSLSTTSQGAENYNLSGAVNLPIIDDKFAVRVVGYIYDNSGFVDNSISGGTSFGIPDEDIENIAGELTKGGRITFKFQATDDLSLEATALVQDQHVSGIPEIILAEGKWKQNRWVEETLNDDFQVYNLTLNYDGDGYDLMMSASYMDREWNQTRDLHTLGILGPNTPTLLFDSNDEEIFVQEVRLSSNNDSPLQWLFGAFHLKKNLNFTNHLDWYGSAETLAAIIPSAVRNEAMHSRDNDITDEQYALFGEASYQITDTLEAVAGLRWFKYETVQNLEVFGIFQNDITVIGTSASTFTPKFALNFEPDDNHLYYASATKGFRPGAANKPVPEDICGDDLRDLGFSEAPDGTTPDSLWSYEVGAKINSEDGRMALSAAAFYVDWTNIPTGLVLPCGFGIGFNADSATSKGVEMELAIQVSENMRIDFGGAYTDAQLDPSIDPITGARRNEGGRTPGIPKITFTLGTQYDFTLADRDSTLRLDANYVGDYSNALPSSTNGTESGDYFVMNLRWSTDFNGWSVELFANNLLNETVNIVVDTEIGDGRTYRGRPRTVGARIRHNF